MKLRLLEKKDIPGMLEWMHDSEVNRFFRFDADNMTTEKAEEFIDKALEDASQKRSFHFAIVDDNDEYMGTISLKDIDWDAKTGEYAISLRRSAQGKGIGSMATKQLLEFAFSEIELNRVFLNVLEDNNNAIKLYEKAGFRYEGMFKNHICIRGNIKSLKWYGILKEEWEEENG